MVTNPLWQQNLRDLAKALLGKPFVVGETTATILKTQPYPRGENTGPYARVLTMTPGQIYCPRVRNSVIILVTAHDGGSPGGCILIRAIEVGGQIYKGPGRVAERLGIVEPRTIGSLFLEEDGKTIVVGLGTAPRPVVKPGRVRKAKTGNGIGEEALRRLAPQIAAGYLKKKPGTPFPEWLDGLLQEATDEAGFRRLLR